MDRQSLVDLYVKEREYQEKIFGKYEDIKTFNLATFLSFIIRYAMKCNEAYVSKWVKKRPSWLLTCKEKELGGEDSAFPAHAVSAHEHGGKSRNTSAFRLSAREFSTSAQRLL